MRPEAPQAPQQVPARERPQCSVRGKMQKKIPWHGHQRVLSVTAAFLLLFLFPLRGFSEPLPLESRQKELAVEVKVNQSADSFAFRSRRISVNGNLRHGIAVSPAKQVQPKSSSPATESTTPSPSPQPSPSLWPPPPLLPPSHALPPAPAPSPSSEPFMPGSSSTGIAYLCNISAIGGLLCVALFLFGKIHDDHQLPSAVHVLSKLQVSCRHGRNLMLLKSAGVDIAGTSSCLDKLVLTWQGPSTAQLSGSLFRKVP